MAVTLSTCTAHVPHLVPQVYVWEDMDDDNDVITEYRTYEGHREDITHMAGEEGAINVQDLRMKKRREKEESRRREEGERRRREKQDLRKCLCGKMRPHDSGVSALREAHVTP